MRVLNLVSESLVDTDSCVRILTAVPAGISGIFAGSHTKYLVVTPQLYPDTVLNTF